MIIAIILARNLKVKDSMSLPSLLAWGGPAARTAASGPYPSLPRWGRGEGGRARDGRPLGVVQSMPPACTPPSPVARPALPRGHGRICRRPAQRL